jgi:hypothetical protein
MHLSLQAQHFLADILLGEDFEALPHRWRNTSVGSTPRPAHELIRGENLSVTVMRDRR